MENSRVFVRAAVHEDSNLAAGILLSTSLLGLVTYIWAFWCQRSRVKNIRGPLFTLICVDITNLITGIIVGSGYADSSSNSGTWFNSTFAWLLTRSCGVILHLLTSAWFLFCLKHSQLEANLHYIFRIAFILICVSPVFAFVNNMAIYILGFIASGLFFDVIANSRVSATSPAAAKEKKLIMILAMCIFWVVFFPSFVLECLLSNNFDVQIIYVNVLFFTNFHLFFNGLLCLLILKLSATAEAKQQKSQQLWQLQQQQKRQQPQQVQWQQPKQQQQQQQQQPQPQGRRNPGFDVSVFTIDKGQNSNLVSAQV